MARAATRTASWASTIWYGHEARGGTRERASVETTRRAAKRRIEIGRTGASRLSSSPPGPSRAPRSSPAPRPMGSDGRPAWRARQAPRRVKAPRASRDSSRLFRIPVRRRTSATAAPPAPERAREPIQAPASALTQRDPASSSRTAASSRRAIPEPRRPMTCASRLRQKSETRGPQKEATAASTSATGRGRPPARPRTAARPAKVTRVEPATTAGSRQFRRPAGQLAPRPTSSPAHTPVPVAASDSRGSREASTADRTQGRGERPPGSIPSAPEGGPGRARPGR